MIIEYLISEIGNINNKYPNIDFGGCGTFSYFLSEKLDNLNIDNEIVYIPEENTPVGSYRCDVKFQHILVKVGDYLIDNNGIRNINGSLLSLDKSKLKDMLGDKKLWNNIFSHEHWDFLADDIMNMKFNKMEESGKFLVFNILSNDWYYCSEVNLILDRNWCESNYNLIMSGDILYMDFMPSHGHRELKMVYYKRGKSDVLPKPDNNLYVDWIGVNYYNGPK